jgi:hypothetical protein
MRNIWLVESSLLLYAGVMSQLVAQKVLRYLKFSVSGFAILFAACSPMRFSSYTGTGSWPVGTGTMAETTYRVPVYRGWPERPYVVLGSMRFEDSRQWWDEGIVEDAASAAKKRGGEAIILRHGSESGVIGFADALAEKLITSQNETTALVIRWKTPEEIKEEAVDRQRFIESVSRKVPQAVGRDGVIVLLNEIAIRQALKAYSEEAETMVVTMLTKILESKQGASGLYATKVTIRKESIATSGSEVLVGLVTVEEKNGSLVIMSNPAQWQMNFSGALQDGKLSGQLGMNSIVGTATAHAEGVAIGDRISLTSSTRTPDGVFQASVILIR